MDIDGSCHCGAVRYRARIDPGKVTICHCTDCQKLTGSPYRVSTIAARSDIELMGEEPRTYVKHGDNGRPRHQLFCGRCGSPLFTHGEGEEAQEWGIRWGSISQRAELAPRDRIWCRSAPPWSGTIDTLPGRPED
ncbi:GFA family protein [Aureimonas populi]|uniref:GFA family protein n=1 Tax=Aureimonas populi TaxID=1701758 RepID=A0ABW5CRY2_9HYPH|nr:GFA family protein [Aureimonas populi]